MQLAFSLVLCLPFFLLKAAAFAAILTDSNLSVTVPVMLDVFLTNLCSGCFLVVLEAKCEFEVI